MTEEFAKRILALGFVAGWFFSVGLAVGMLITIKAAEGWGDRSGSERGRP